MYDDKCRAGCHPRSIFRLYTNSCITYHRRTHSAHSDARLALKQLLCGGWRLGRVGLARRDRRLGHVGLRVRSMELRLLLSLRSSLLCQLLQEARVHQCDVALVVDVPASSTACHGKAAQR